MNSSGTVGFSFRPAFKRREWIRLVTAFFSFMDNPVVTVDSYRYRIVRRDFGCFFNEAMLPLV
jgi:hypothetical protein